jgi:hypothetical protein
MIEVRRLICETPRKGGLQRKAGLDGCQAFRLVLNLERTRPAGTDPMLHVLAADAQGAAIFADENEDRL